MHACGACLNSFGVYYCCTCQSYLRSVAEKVIAESALNAAHCKTRPRQSCDRYLEAGKPVRIRAAIRQENGRERLGESAESVSTQTTMPAETLGELSEDSGARR